MKLSCAFLTSSSLPAQLLLLVSCTRSRQLLATAFTETRITATNACKMVLPNEKKYGRTLLFVAVEPPPDFSIVDDDDDGAISSSAFPEDAFEQSKSSESADIEDTIRNDEDDNHSFSERSESSSSSRQQRSTRSGPRVVTRSNSSKKRKNQKLESATAAASWMERNSKFVGNGDADPNETNVGAEEESANNNNNRDRSFREDFRGTRVFVQGLPPRAAWQDVKDHFRVAGEVVFASVSLSNNHNNNGADTTTQHGIVQFETTDMAAKAIQIMRDHPMDGYNLYVREDVQENKGRERGMPASSSNANSGRNTGGISNRRSANEGWKCANDETQSNLSPQDLDAVQSLIRNRDDARKRRNYDSSDRIRDNLKRQYGVHLDDRLKMWWTDSGGAPPQTIREIKGEGRWGLPATDWRQIPTVPEQDAQVDPDLVMRLLKQRDVARRQKDFQTADELLEQARTSPNGELNLRIHDESRTWRIWTEGKPPPSSYDRRQPGNFRDSDGDNDYNGSGGSGNKNQDPGEQCLEIVREHAPHKIEEIETVLRSFPGREYQVLKKLKRRYLQSSSE